MKEKKKKKSTEEKIKIRVEKIRVIDEEVIPSHEMNEKGRKKKKEVAKRI